MLGGRVEGRTIEDGMAARRDELAGEVRVHLRVVGGDCTPVEKVRKVSRKANILLLADFVALAHAEVRLHEPRRTECAGIANGDSTGRRVLTDVDPLSAACDKRRERARESESNIRVAGLW